MKRSDFDVYSVTEGRTWKIFHPKKYFLWENGSFNLGTDEQNGRWPTKQEAENFLRNYLMSDINTKIQQCEEDIASLQENLEKLKKEKIPGPRPIYVFSSEVGVGISEDNYYIIVRGRPTGNSNNPIDGFPITANEATKLIEALQTMIDYVESN